MSGFKGSRQVCSTSIHLLAAPKTVFPLFEPAGERAWAPDWDPIFVYPAGGSVEVGAVFVVNHAGHPGQVVWTVTRYEPEQYHLSYLRVANEHHVAEIDITCREPLVGATLATVTYRFTGLSDVGNEFVSLFTEEYYQNWLHSWETAINQYLQKEPGSAEHPHFHH
jgi:Polyketide cyclase / dehydrase and lipid transport.